MSVPDQLAIEKLSEKIRSIASSSRHNLESGSIQLESLDALDKRADIDDKKNDTTLKTLYAKHFIWILVGQLIAMNAVFAGVGIGCLSFDDPTHLNLYMSGTLAEVFGIVLVITKYLFSKKSSSAQ